MARKGDLGILREQAKEILISREGDEYVTLRPGYVAGIASKLNESANTDDNVLAKELFRLAYPKTLERISRPVAAAVFIVAGIFFLSPHFTGNAVGNLNIIDSSIVGVILFIFGIVISYFLFRKRYLFKKEVSSKISKPFRKKR